MSLKKVIRLLDALQHKFDCAFIKRNILKMATYPSLPPTAFESIRSLNSNKLPKCNYLLQCFYFFNLLSIEYKKCIFKTLLAKGQVEHKSIYVYNL